LQHLIESLVKAMYYQSNTNQRKYKMKVNSVMVQPIIDSKLKEIVANRIKSTGIATTKVNVVAELINAAHKKEVK
jgi:predicted transcriptional regulator